MASRKMGTLIGRTQRELPNEEIKDHGCVFTPDQYVGAAEIEGEGEPFEEKMERFRLLWLWDGRVILRCVVNIKRILCGGIPFDFSIGIGIHNPCLSVGFAIIQNLTSGLQRGKGV
ncbi:MAG: hypothetical protein GH155_04525 [Spirochaeta sp.]|nr:hypothetical protein [Spirochaeta sp.]